MTAFGIRVATLDDVARMAEIARGNPTAPQWTAAQLHDLLTSSSEPRLLMRGAVVYQKGSEVYGFALASVLSAVFPIEAELESLAVAPGYHGRGIGRHLLMEMSWWALCRGARMMRLEVRASNERALRMYSKAGFQQTGRRPGYYSDPVEDAIVMERTIPTAADYKPRALSLA